MADKYRISDILYTDGPNRFEQRTDGRYPQRIGRICEKPRPTLGLPMYINYIANTDGSDYSGYQLRTSTVNGITEQDDCIVVATINSIYRFIKVED
jgi:hypothetical protein